MVIGSVRRVHASYVFFSPVLCAENLLSLSVEMRVVWPLWGDVSRSAGYVFDPFCVLRINPPIVRCKTCGSLDHPTLCVTIRVSSTFSNQTLRIAFIPCQPTTLDLVLRDTQVLQLPSGAKSMIRPRTFRSSRSRIRIRIPMAIRDRLEPRVRQMTSSDTRLNQVPVQLSIKRGVWNSMKWFFSS